MKSAVYQASSVPSLVHCKKGTNTGWLKEFGYTNTWSTWIHHNLSSNHNRERLQIVKLLLVHLSIRCKQRKSCEFYAKSL